MRSLWALFRGTSTPEQLAANGSRSSPSPSQSGGGGGGGAASKRGTNPAQAQLLSAKRPPRLLHGLIDDGAALPSVLLGVLLDANSDDSAFHRTSMTVAEWQASKSRLYLEAVVKYLAACFLHALVTEYAKNPPRPPKALSSSSKARNSNDNDSGSESPLSDISSSEDEQEDEILKPSPPIPQTSKTGKRPPSEFHMSTRKKAHPKAPALPASFALTLDAQVLDSIRDMDIGDVLAGLQKSLALVTDLTEVAALEPAAMTTRQQHAGLPALIPLADIMQLILKHQWDKSTKALHDTIAYYDTMFSSVIAKAEVKRPDNLNLLYSYLRLGHWMQLNVDSGSSAAGNGAADAGSEQAAKRPKREGKQNDAKQAIKRQKLDAMDEDEATVDGQMHTEGSSRQQELEAQLQILQEHVVQLAEERDELREKCVAQQEQIQDLNNTLVTCRQSLMWHSEQHTTLDATATARERELETLIAESAQLRNDNERMANVLSAIELEKAKKSNPVGTYTFDLNPVKANTEVTAFTQELEKFSRALLVANKAAIKSTVIPAVVRTLHETHPDVAAVVTAASLRQNHVSKYIVSRIYQILTVSLAVNPIGDITGNLQSNIAQYFTRTAGVDADANGGNTSADAYFLTHDAARQLFTIAAGGPHCFTAAWNTYFQKIQETIVADLQILGLSFGVASSATDTPSQQGSSQTQKLQNLIVKFAQTYFLLKAVDINWQITFPAIGSVVTEDAVNVESLIATENDAHAEEDKANGTLHKRTTTVVVVPCTPLMHISNAGRQDILVKASVIAVRIPHACTTLRLCGQHRPNIQGRG
ncbi:hypothetical protein RI367_003876 [Sorochytrium milnesiophthora]